MPFLLWIEMYQLKVSHLVRINLVFFLDNSTKKVLYNLPANDTTVASGSCDGEKNVLLLGWKKGNTVKLTFSVNNTVKEYDLSEMRFDLNASDIFADAKGRVS